MSTCSFRVTKNSLMLFAYNSARNVMLLIDCDTRLFCGCLVGRLTSQVDICANAQYKLGKLKSSGL